ncbi:MAG: hypothetical protein ABF289_11425 [Clostridiales bacterium]
MKKLIISYSFTGNNKMLSQSVAKELAADIIEVTELKERTIKTIIIDIMFNREPNINPIPNDLKDYDIVILNGPIWMGKVASPLCSYFKYISNAKCDYAFFSISGGAYNKNTNLEKDIRKKAKRDAIAVVDIHLADYLTDEDKKSSDDKVKDKLKSKDLDEITKKVSKALIEKFSCIGSGR